MTAIQVSCDLCHCSYSCLWCYGDYCPSGQVHQLCVMRRYSKTTEAAGGLLRHRYSVQQKDYRPQGGHRGCRERGSMCSRKITERLHSEYRETAEKVQRHWQSVHGMTDLGQIAAVQVSCDLCHTSSSCLWCYGDYCPSGQVHQPCAEQHVEQPCQKQPCVLNEPPAC